MTTWVFLRGLTRECRHWGDFVETFQRTVPDARVVTLDLPGNGRLHRMTSPSSVQGMVDHCRDALSRHGIAPPYNLLAMSLGAMVAVAWAGAHPRDLTHCVLINTSLRPFSPFYRRLRPRNYLPLLKLALIGGSARDWEQTILRITSTQQVGAAKVLNDWIAFRGEHPVSRRNAFRQLYAAARYRAPAEPPAAPILILASDKDALAHVSCSQALAAAWSCEIRIHRHAGHDVPLDDGPWVAAQVRDWLVQ